MIDVLVLGAGWATESHPVTDAFIEALDSARFVPRVVPYSSLRASGREVLAQAIEQTANRVVIAGYAQGAAIAGDFAQEVGDDVWVHLEVIACALIADPLRPSGKHIGADPGGHGIGGERRIDRLPTYWAAAQDDPITALPADNPLRTIANLADYLAVSSEDEINCWAQKLVDISISKLCVRSCSLEFRHKWGRALAHARALRFDGRHSTDYARYGHAVALAEVINRTVPGSD
ncbi:hypothetical protein [Nocardia brasiliensis]|uniref:hypothetical protein n=1 Tax=Nocardia brasiliensis TaxID=37326 RepID=UPI003D93A5EF